MVTFQRTEGPALSSFLSPTPLRFSPLIMEPHLGGLNCLGAAPLLTTATLGFS